jgi:hypothetical protein
MKEANRVSNSLENLPLVSQKSKDDSTKFVTSSESNTRPENGILSPGTK